VLVDDDKCWHQYLLPGLRAASLDGENLVPQRVPAKDPEDLEEDDMLDLFEYAPLLVADLAGMAPEVFSLVSWHARAHPESVLLVRHGTTPLPFELQAFAVRALDLEDEARGPDVRRALSDWAAIAAKRRRHDDPIGSALTMPWGNQQLQRRRRRSGVIEHIREASRGLLQGDLRAARNAMLRALRAEPHAPDLLLRTALLHRRAGCWQDAAATLEQAMTIIKHHAPIWRELGIVRQQIGLPDGEQLLRQAARHDHEALVALALSLGRSGGTAEAAQLFERAMRAADGQLNLVLPALLARARENGRVSLSPAERGHLQEVLTIRRTQAERDPPDDPPWSGFDAAKALLLLGDEAQALEMVKQAAPHIVAWWQTQTFGESLLALEEAGIDVQPFRAVLDLRADETGTVEIPRETATPPFQASARGPDWYPENVPCMAACPVGTDAGSYVHLLAQGEVADAFRVARGPNPFASICGRICAAPCEDACRRGNIDAPVEIRSLKRYLTEHHGVEGPEPLVQEVLEGDAAPCIEGPAYGSHLSKIRGKGDSKRVAVIGGGPAGLACAHDLALLGHQVTVFEASGELGGMMRQGIPVYRLPRDLLDQEIEAILSLGVEVRLHAPLTPQQTLASLLETGFDAAFLGTGAGRARGLDVEGGDLDGVVSAIEFLLNANQGYRMRLGRRVLVVGGGNVALDCARTSRLGRPPDPRWRAKDRKAARETFGPTLGGRALRDALAGGTREVHVIARQPMGEWPAQRTVRGTEELELAKEEGIVFHPLRGLRRIRGKQGRVTGVELAEVVRLYDDKGRYAPMYGAHAAESIECDTVLLAVGQTPDLDYLGAEIDCTSRGHIAVDRETLATSMPGVYAGGDAAFGARTIIEGVADGKRAARHMHAWLVEAGALRTDYRFEQLHPRDVPTAEDYDRRCRESPPAVAVDRRTGVAEVETGFEKQQAIEQAERCLVCHVQTVYDGDLCIACGRCTDVCPYTCLSFVLPGDVGGLVPELERRLTAEPDQVFLIKDEDQCIRCGLCAERCPTGAMTMERFEQTVVQQ
jgi:NADPH-dependent glutamate synthase beta subunit-like oxidoreductase/tetratricopeptide (TPR) repeat protein